MSHAISTKPQTSPSELAKQPLKEVRCPKCKALLFKAAVTGEIETKCRKCGKVFTLSLVVSTVVDEK
jgi:phage FluMu protein Com